MKSLLKAVDLLLINNYRFTNIIDGGKVVSGILV